jgi:hypothetical protein
VALGEAFGTGTRSTGRLKTTRPLSAS